MKQLLKKKNDFLNSRPFIQYFFIGDQWWDFGHERKRWNEFRVSFVFVIGFSTTPVAFLGVANEKSKQCQWVELMEDKVSPVSIIESCTRLVCTLFSDLHWKQQREIILDIGKLVKNQWVLFNSENKHILDQNSIEEDGEKLDVVISVSGEEEAFTDVLLIESFIEKALNISTD